MRIPGTEGLLLASAGCLVLLASCGRPESGDDRGAMAEPSIAELRSATFHKIYDEPLTLVDGRWEGLPFTEGGSSRPRAGIADVFYAAGDLDGDGNGEAAVIIWENSGGSGSYHYLAVSRRENEEIVNVDTVLVEDRPKILSLHISDRQVVLELIQHGPDEPACCPTQHALRRWQIVEGKLAEQAVEIVQP